MTLRALVVWLGLMLLAILNGALRNYVLTPRLGQSIGHIVSTLILCAAIAAVAWLTIRWIDPTDSSQAIAIGAMWLLLTLAFEFGAGHYLFGQPWSQLLADYNVFRGRIWVLVLLTTAAAPLLARRARGL